MKKLSVTQLKNKGEQDFLAGKSIDAYYDLPRQPMPERSRAAYEMGWRAAKSEKRKGGVK